MDIDLFLGVFSNILFQIIESLVELIFCSVVIVFTAAIDDFRCLLHYTFQLDYYAMCCLNS